MSTELENIAGEAAALDADLAAEQVQPDQPGISPGMTDRTTLLAGEINMLLSMLVNVVAPALPSVKAIYTEQVTAALSEAAARVCVKHGWLTDGIGGKWAEEIALAAIAMPVAFATVKAVKHDIAINKAREQNPDGNGMADADLAQKAAA